MVNDQRDDETEMIKVLSLLSEFTIDHNKPQEKAVSCGEGIKDSKRIVLVSNHHVVSCDRNSNRRGALLQIYSQYHTDANLSGVNLSTLLLFSTSSL